MSQTKKLFYLILLIVAVIVLVSLNELGYGIIAFPILMVFIWWLVYYKICPEKK